LLVEIKVSLILLLLTFIRILCLQVVYWSRLCGIVAIADCVWSLKRFYALMMENPDDLQMAKAIFSMHFIVAFLSLLYRLANTFAPNHGKVDLFKRIVQNMQQVQNCPFFEHKRKVQKNQRLVLFLAFLHLGYTMAAVVTDAEIRNHGAVYATAKLLVSLVHQLMLVSEMVLYWALALCAASQLDACGRNLRKRAVPRAAAHLRFCLWKMLQVIGDVDEAFGPMLLLVLTSRNIYIQMDVYNVLQNLIAYSGEGNKLHAAAVCFLWTLLDLITIFMMLFPAILILRKVCRGVNKCILRSWLTLLREFTP
jgi:hypothetical protein